MAEINYTNFGSISMKDIEAEADLIPLMTPEDEEALNNEALPDSIPILPLKNTVLFPGVVIPITASRDRSIELIKDANNADKVIGVVAQKDQSIENPDLKDLYEIGTVAQILRVLKMPDGNTTVIIQGKKRFQIHKIISEKPYIKAKIIPVDDNIKSKNNKEVLATVDSIRDLALQIIQENPNIPSEASFAIKNINSNSFLINFVSSNMNLNVSDKQKILFSKSLSERALMCLKYMNTEYQKLALKNDIRSRVRLDMDQQQKEYYLNQQLKRFKKSLVEFHLKRRLMN